MKNGRSLGGYGAVAMNAALAASTAQLPEQLRKTLTWDRGKELSGHRRRHSRLGNLSPAAYEQQITTQTEVSG